MESHEANIDSHALNMSWHVDFMTENEDFMADLPTYRENNKSDVQNQLRLTTKVQLLRVTDFVFGERKMQVTEFNGGCATETYAVKRIGILE